MSLTGGGDGGVLFLVHAVQNTTLGALMRNFYSGSWPVPYWEPPPIHRTMARWPKNQEMPGGEFHGSPMYRLADSLEMDSATSSALPGYLSVSQSYGMEPVDNHSLLLTACNRLQTPQKPSPLAWPRAAMWGNLGSS